MTACFGSEGSLGDSAQDRQLVGLWLRLHKVQSSAAGIINVR